MRIGILGDGQLARMLALAAYPLGIQTLCYGADANGSAGQVTNVLKGTYDDENALKAFFSQVDVVTYETENIPWEKVEKANPHCPVFPSFQVLKIAQDRVQEKTLFKSLEISTPEFAVIESLSALTIALPRIGLPAVLKTSRFGYDGKGQFILRITSDAEAAWEALNRQPCILEQFIDYQRELSLLLVRNTLGEIKFYSLIENHHRDGILCLSKAPLNEPMLQQQAEDIADKMMQRFNYIGVFCIEFFQVGLTLMVNEIAPRVHNSGHWTIEGAQTSQFENHCRAITGLPLGSTQACGLSAMINCVGDEPSLATILAMPGVHYHHYGKERRPNRKLGHITLNTTDQPVYSTYLQDLKVIMKITNID